ncbi:MFS transporter [Streptomyces sp. NPDC052013]|uniref:MFS transporter n=1 Tax=Streptomyces sp. NPDC052013 TaxID=3365679 RepID=UPI0037D4306C
MRSSPATPSGGRPPVPGARRVVGFTFLFFTGMWLSKTVHPLYFDRHDHLVNFGLSYTAMAVAGTTSVFIGRLADRWGPRAVLVAGTVLYAAGMTLRTVHDSAPAAVASGLVAGIGASSVFIGLRTWTLHNTTEEQRPGLVSRREFMTQAGTALGMGGAGALAAFAGAGDRGYVFVLLLAAGCVLAGLLLIPPSRTGPGSGGPAKGAEAGFATVFRQHRGLALGIVGLGLLMGFYVSILSPYLPLLLAERGVPVALVGVVLAVASVVRLTAAALAGRYLRERSPLAVFLVSESCCAAATLVLALSVSPWLAACALALRGAFLLGATVSQELLQLNAFPSALAGVFFGLVQSAFLAGDSLGGALGGWLYHQLGSSQTVLIATGLTLANALLVPAFYGRLRRLAETDPERQRAHAAP